MNDQLTALFGSAVGMLPTAPARSLQMFSEITAIDETACDAVLGALVDAHFLERTRDGAFVRYDGRS